MVLETWRGPQTIFFPFSFFSFALVVIRLVGWRQNTKLARPTSVIGHRDNLKHSRSKTSNRHYAPKRGQIGARPTPK
jgi:hypothetical protein